MPMIPIRLWARSDHRRHLHARERLLPKQPSPDLCNGVVFGAEGGPRRGERLGERKVRFQPEVLTHVFRQRGVFVRKLTQPLPGGRLYAAELRAPLVCVAPLRAPLRRISSTGMPVSACLSGATGLIVDGKL